MKRVLIISPYFPPVNAPDMQRVRMSLPYFKENGWEPTVVAVDEKHAHNFTDPLLPETIPDDIQIIKVAAFSQAITSKLGVGNVSLRSLYHFRKAGNRLLKSKQFDLVFFSTSNHHICVLGRYWKKKFNVPFVIDMQDPWRNDIHLETERYKNSFKYRLAYSISKKLEANTMPYVDGIVSVSKAYISILKERYPALANIPTLELSFGSSLKDYELVKQKNFSTEIIHTANKKSVLYMGAVTPHFMPVIRLFFEALLENNETLKNYHFYFIGTSYAKGSGTTLVANLAEELGISEHVTEHPDRVPFFNSLAILQAADVLFIPGSIDKDYNASKVYNNILSGTPIFSIFHQQSSVVEAIEISGTGTTYSFENLNDQQAMKDGIHIKWLEFLTSYSNYHLKNPSKLDFTADVKTQQLCNFFNEVLACAEV